MKFLSNVIFFSFLSIVLGFDLEDLRLKAVFPPVVPDVPGEPRGHNKHLGWQRPPEAEVKEYTEALNADDYWKQHVKDHIPLVYRGYIKDSPAIKLWDDEYLKEHYGDLDLLVEHKLEDRTSTSGRMKLKDFLKNYKEQDMYVVSMFPTEMMHEIRAIPSILCGTFKDFTHESNLWLSNGGTRSVVHYDADHNLHCVIDGRKDFIMINNNITTKTNLYFKRKDPGVGSGFSFLDPDKIDMNKFQKIAKVPWTWATLYPGDCIYIPSIYIHQVRGYGRTIAVTTLFTADVKDNFNGDDCTDDIMKKYHSMADIKFQWTYKKGDPTIDMGYMNVAVVKQRILEGLADDRFTRNRKFTLKQFVLYSGVFSPYARNKTKMANIWKNTFGLKENDVMDKGTIESLSLEQWKVYCRAVEAAHGVVTNGTESVFVRPGERHQWEIDHPDEDDDNHMTEKERQISAATSRDPMFDYLTPKEKEEYIKKRKEEKAKFGVAYNARDEELDVGGEIPWRLDDVPKQYRAEIAEGKIPEKFKEEFLGGLPDEVRRRFEKELNNNRIPKEVLSVITEQGLDSYARVISKQMQGDDGDLEGDDEDGDDFGDELTPHEEDGFPFTFDDLDEERQKSMIEGIILKGDVDQFLEHLPEQYQTEEFFKEVRQGKLPKKMLIDLMGSTEENFEEDVAKIKRRFGKPKDEL